MLLEKSNHFRVFDSSQCGDQVRFYLLLVLPELMVPQVVDQRINVLLFKNGIAVSFKENAVFLPEGGKESGVLSSSNSLPIRVSNGTKWS